MIRKVEISGVNTTKLPALSNEEKKEIADKLKEIDNENIFEFVENADYRYRLDVIGLIDRNGEIQRLKI